MPEIALFKSRFWFSLSLIAAIFFSLNASILAFQDPYVVQDDSRQHVFWMHRFSDRTLFPDDLIADYFQSLAPLGYTSLYKIVNFVGIAPFVFNKFLPIIICIVTTIYGFKFCLEIFPVPLAAFLFTLFLNQNLWLVDLLSSGTPRAFIYPLLLAFLYYLSRSNFLLCGITIVLQAEFYPQAVLISLGVLFCHLWAGKKGKFFLIKENIIAIIFVGIVGILSLLIYAPDSSKFQPILTVGEAINFPELLAGGRSSFFGDNPWYFWLVAPRSGIFPLEWSYVLPIAWIYLAIVSFTLLMPYLNKKYLCFPLIKKISDRQRIIGEFLLASLTIFCLAHLLLFQLHLPSRYTQHSLRIILNLFAGIGVTICFDNLYRMVEKLINLSFRYRRISLCLATGETVEKIRVKISPRVMANSLTFLLIFLLFLPTYIARQHPQYSKMLGYVKGEAPEVYKFLSQQPKDIMVVSLTKEADFIPTFSRRSVLFSPEYSLPYHLGYFQKIRERTSNAIAAQYTERFEELKKFIQKYHLNYWLIDRRAFTVKYLVNNSWLMQFTREIDEAITNLKKNNSPALAKLTSQCTILKEKDLLLISTTCILQSKSK